MAGRRKGTPVHGWVLLDKPVGLTSTAAVAKVKRLFEAQKAGHAGTLDPLATGLLAIALGEATKTIPFVMDAEKTYRFTARWGEATETDDAEGRIVAESPVRPEAEAIVRALSGFIGEVTQVPPAYSAIKVDGARAYDLAREGEAPEMKPRTVSIRRLELIAAGTDSAEFLMVCGKGTYVRAFVRDLARALGTVAHVAALRRERTGPFGPDRMVTLDKLAAFDHGPALLTALAPVETALDGIPALAIGGADADRLRNGGAVPIRGRMLAEIEQASGGMFGPGLTMLVRDLRGVPLALVSLENGALHPARVFHLDAVEGRRS